MHTQNLCPLCKAPNSCALVETGNTNGHCWCMDVKIAPEILAQLTTEQKNTACICHQCAFPSNTR